MNPYNNFNTPSVSVTFTMVSAWLVFIVIAILFSLDGLPMGTDWVSRVAGAAVLAVAAVGFLVAGQRLKGAEQEVAAQVRDVFSREPSWLHEEEKPGRKAA